MLGHQVTVVCVARDVPFGVYRAREVALLVVRVANDGQPVLAREIGRDPDLEDATAVVNVHLIGPTGSVDDPRQHAVRIALALAAARLIAGGLDLSHGFWALLTTLTVMRTSAAGTRTTVIPAVRGTLVGAVLAAALLLLAGDHTLVYAVAMPPVFFLAFTGLVISLWPYIVSPTITLWDAAAAPKSQAFLMVGTLFLLPIIMLYVVWSYWVFRGKVRGDHGYHD